MEISSGSDMLLDNLDIKVLPDGITVRVRVQPRSSKNAIAGIMGNSLKINLTSPPVDGEANAACLAFIAGLMHLPKNAVTITSGQTNRQKIIKLNGIDKNNFFALLSAYI